MFMRFNQYVDGSLKRLLLRKDKLHGRGRAE
jgi:hypothetical protein